MLRRDAFIPTFVSEGGCLTFRRRVVIHDWYLEEKQLLFWWSSVGLLFWQSVPGSIRALRLTPSAPVRVSALQSAARKKKIRIWTINSPQTLVSLNYINSQAFVPPKIGLVRRKKGNEHQNYKYNEKKRWYNINFSFSNANNDPESLSISLQKYPAELFSVQQKM